MPAREKTKKRNIGETEEAEQEVLSKRGKLNGRKRNIGNPIVEVSGTSGLKY